MNKHIPVYLWVNITGGVLGFSIGEILAFEADYKELQSRVKDISIGYWNYFEYYFAEELDGRSTSGYSAIWNHRENWLAYEVMKEERYESQ